MTSADIEVRGCVGPPGCMGDCQDYVVVFSSLYVDEVDCHSWVDCFYTLVYAFKCRNSVNRVSVSIVVKLDVNLSACH